MLIGGDAGDLCGRLYFVDGCLQMNAALRSAANTPIQAERLGFERSSDSILEPLLSTRGLLLLWFVLVWIRSIRVAPRDEELRYADAEKDAGLFQTDRKLYLNPSSVVVDVVVVV